jgi:hypothetical protein
MHKFSLAEAIVKAGERMAAELRERLVPHAGEQGRARENTIKDFLTSYLPTTFDVGSGFVFDVNGAVSDQLDIIIADSTVAPKIQVAGGIRFYPCEAVVAVGQVKTRCDSRRKTWDAFCNLRSASVLDRSAAGRAMCTRTGEPIDHTSSHLDRIFTFLFIVDEALGGDTMQQVLLDYVVRSDSYLWPNLVFALDRYIVTFCCDDGVCPNTIHARGISLSRHSEGNETLLQFYVYLFQACMFTSVAPMCSPQHLRGLPGTRVDADVIHSTFHDDDEPPPLLSEWHRQPWEHPYPEESPESVDD